MIVEGGVDEGAMFSPGLPLPQTAQQGHVVPESEYDDPKALQEALQKYSETLENLFPRAVPEKVLVEHVSKVLNKHGYTTDTSINLVSTCRDEICRPFVSEIDKVWHTNSFNISSLGGMVFCGRTGFKAAMAHAPVVDGQERYVFWVAPHIAVSLEGIVGKIFRFGMDHPSSACGALLAVLNEVKSLQLNVGLDPTDLEQSLLKQRLVSHIRYGHVPSLVELTYAAYECILKEVMETAKKAIDINHCEYVIVAGIQVHGPLDTNFFWPGSIKRHKNGDEIDLYEEYAASVADWSHSGGDTAWGETGSALQTLQKRRRECRLAVVSGDLQALKKIHMSVDGVHDNQLRNLLHIAAIHDHPEIAKHLLAEAPTLLHEGDINHCYPLDYCVDNEQSRVAPVLIHAGGVMSHGRLRQALVDAVKGGKVSQLARLVDISRNSDAVASAVTDEGQPLMHVALEYDDPQIQREMLKILSIAGAAANEYDIFGNDTLKSARRLGREDSTKDL